MSWMLGVGAVALGFMVGWFMGVLSTSGPTAAPAGIRARPWTPLPSGLMCGYGRGLSGYVTVVEGRPFWWVTREYRTVIEGPAESIAAAKLEADDAAKWLLDGK